MAARKTPAPTRSIKRGKQKSADLFSGYSRQKRPLGGYAALCGLFTLGLSSALTNAKRNERKFSDLSWSDWVLLGIATHKLGRIVTKDLVTSPFRAPFVKFVKSAGAGEVEEKARGEGIQEAIGDLITCPYCIAPWVASALVFAHRQAPRATRIIAAVFSVTAASDFLNRLYARLEE